jgi:hypothetical protein
VLAGDGIALRNLSGDKAVFAGVEAIVSARKKVLA